MFKVCLFDLDQTLVMTEDMKELRESGKNKTEIEYREQVRETFNQKKDRLFYPEELLLQIRDNFPGMKLGVFTRSPRSYAKTILKEAYPSLRWDIVIAYEDVQRTKPYGEGVDKAMFSFGYEHISRVVLVGDGDTDIRAAYNAGCVAVLDRSSWNLHLESDNWRSLSRIPDVIIHKPGDIIKVLENYKTYLPELERLLYKARNEDLHQPRFDRINKFIPREAGGGTTPFPIFSCGRSFANYKSLEWRKKWHKLTKSIIDQKEADEFPVEWIQAVRTFIGIHFKLLPADRELVVSVIPHRPDRKARLEAFLGQLKASFEATPCASFPNLLWVSDLLAYKDGVLSNSNEKLNAVQRFENVKDHLFVKKSDIVKNGKNVLIIDDVCTTGSSLICARNALIDAGASDVTCLAIAMNIGNVLYE